MQSHYCCSLNGAKGKNTSGIQRELCSKSPIMGTAAILRKSWLPTAILPNLSANLRLITKHCLTQMENKGQGAPACWTTVHTHVCTHHMHTYTCTHTHVCMNIHIYLGTHACTQAHTHTNTCMQTHVHINLNAVEKAGIQSGGEWNTPELPSPLVPESGLPVLFLLLRTTHFASHADRGHG